MINHNKKSRLNPLSVSGSILSGISPRHGHVFEPASRAYFAWQDGLIDQGALNQREAGKFFPETSSGLQDKSVPSDVTNFPPPADGKIASAGQGTGQILDEPGTHWRKHEVHSAGELDVSWFFTARHTTRRFNYFITREDWDPSQKLSRAQFESEPFYVAEYALQPYWSHQEALKPVNPTLHTLTLPEREGYHVLLAVWEVADTGNAFYQVIDLDFVSNAAGNEKPSTPTGLAYGELTHKSVQLTWNTSTGLNLIDYYVITRDGKTTVDISHPLQNWTDDSLAPSTTYNFFIHAVDINGNKSAPSRTITVTTLGEGGSEAPPSAPRSLHSMGETDTSVTLMWGDSTGSAALAHYIIYRDGREVQRVPGNQTSFTDTGLTPNTAYRYFVVAEDVKGKLSVPSNVLSVSTKTQGSGGGGGDYPAWALNRLYEVGQRVSHKGKNWEALQQHVSYTADWAPGAADGFVLWKEITTRR